MSTALQNILILGSGGHARVVLDAIRARDDLKPAGFLDDGRAEGEVVDGLPVLGRIERLPEFAKRFNAGAVIAIGANHVRRSLVEQLASLESKVEWLRVIHPAATISRNAAIGEGTVVFAGCVVNPGASIGRHAILNTRSSIDHDTRFGDYSSTGPGVTTGGNVSVGAGSHIGVGATLSHGVKVGTDSVVGAAAAVVRDVPDLSVAYGVPAKVARSRRADEKYL